MLGVHCIFAVVLLLATFLFLFVFLFSFALFLSLFTVYSLESEKVGIYFAAEASGVRIGKAGFHVFSKAFCWGIRNRKI